MIWPQTTIGEVCLPTSQKDPARNGAGSFRYIDISGIDREQKVISRADPIPCADSPSRARKLVQAGDLLVSTVRPNLNAVAIVPEELDGEIASTGFCVLRANRDLAISRYLFYRAQHQQFVDFLVANATGASYPAVTDGIVRRAPLPLPPLPEQTRIVELLDEADRLRRLRRAADAKAARILPALFLKIFGDPATNPMGWRTCRVRDLAIKYSDGPFGSNLKSDHYVPSGIRVIRLQNIGVGFFIDDDKAYISSNHFESLSKHACLPGDIVIGTLGDPNLRACIQPQHIEVALNKADCVQLRVNPVRATREYVCWLLNMPGTLALAQSLVLGQTRTRISMGRLGELMVPTPPIALQEKFSNLVRLTQSTLNVCPDAACKVDGLFDAMLEQAFSGHLTAKWREAHIKELLTEMQQQAKLLHLLLPDAVRLLGGLQP